MNKDMSLHNLRGIACFCVLFAHLFSVSAFDVNSPKEYLGAAFKTPIFDGSGNFLFRLFVSFDHLFADFFGGFLGDLGVLTFFLISGYLIANSLNKYTTQKFLLLRLFRIFPVHLVGLIIIIITVLLYAPVFFHEKYNSAATLFSTIFLVFPFLGEKPISPVAWSLVVEVFFYLYAAMWFKYFKFKTSSIFYSSVFLLLLQLICKFLADTNFVTEIPWLIDLVRAAAVHGFYISFIIVGVSIYAAKNTDNKQKGTLVLVLSFIVIFGAKITNTIVPISPGFSSYMISIFFFYFYNNSHIFNKDIKIFNLLSNISYPMYTIHWIIGWVLLDFFCRLFTPVVSLFLTVIIILILSYVIHKIVEVPFIEISRRCNREIAK